MSGGPIGTASNRIQFADTVNATQQNIEIGGNNPPSSVYLDGLGNLTLSSIMAAPGAPIDVTARGNLMVANGATIISGNSVFSTLSLGADLTPSGAGDDGIGTLTIGASDRLYATNMNLRGADVDIDPTALVLGLSGTPSTILTGGEGPWSMAFDASGNLFVADYYDNTVAEFAPGSSTTPKAILTGFNSPKALVIDASGNLYVANSGNNTVSKFAPGGNTPTATLTGLSGPVAMVMDSTATYTLRMNRAKVRSANSRLAAQARAPRSYWQIRLP